MDLKKYIENAIKWDRRNQPELTTTQEIYNCFNTLKLYVDFITSDYENGKCLDKAFERDIEYMHLKLDKLEFLINKEINEGVYKK